MKMKKILFSLIVIFSVLLTLSGVALSAQGPYVSANLGLGFLMDSDVTEPGFSGKAEYDPGVGIGVAVGYNFGYGRLEGEVGYQKNDFDKLGAFGVSVGAGGDATSASFLVNGYYDFTSNSALKPYISAGIGFAQLEINDLSAAGQFAGDFDDTVLAYQLGFGVGYALDARTTIDLKYRYFATEDPEFDGTKFEYGSHNVFVGIRYNF